MVFETTIIIKAHIAIYNLHKQEKSNVRGGAQTWQTGGLYTLHNRR